MLFAGGAADNPDGFDGVFTMHIFAKSSYAYWTFGSAFTFY